MKRLLVITVVLLVLSSACSYTPTLPSPFTSPTTQVLDGTVYPTGTTTMWLTTTVAGTLRVTLTSAEPGPVTLGLGLGALSGGRCETQMRVDAQPGPTPQITTAADAGTYCVEVSDLGSVTESGVNYSISVEFE